MTLADRDLLDPDDLRFRGAHAPQWFAQVVHFQSLERLPVPGPPPCGDIADRAAPAAPAHLQRKAFRVQRVLDPKVQSLALHRATPPAVDPAHLQVEVNPRVGAGPIPYPPVSAVVPTVRHRTAGAAHRFFPAERGGRAAHRARRRVLGPVAGGENRERYRPPPNDGAGLILADAHPAKFPSFHNRAPTL